MNMVSRVDFGNERFYPPLSSLVGYEIVASPDDFFVSLNDGIEPSACTGFSIGESGCMVFHLEDGTSMHSWPLPSLFQEVINAETELLVVKFRDGEPTDSKVLKRISH